MGDEYEPGDNRQYLKHPTSFIETLFHFLKANIGTGILAMPSGFLDVGWCFGIIGTIILGCLCTYNTSQLAKVQRYMCIKEKKPAMTYEETANSSLKYGPECLRDFKYFGAIGNFFVILFQFGCACIYVVFVSSNIEQLVEHHKKGTDLNVRIYMLIMMIPECIVALINNLKFLAYLCLAGNIFMISGFIMIFYYLFRDIPPISEREAFGDVVGKLPMFVGLVLFSMMAIGVVLPLENEMKNPKQFTGYCGIINWGMTPTIALYTLFGFMGYLRYGKETAGAITLNLPKSETLAQVAQVFLIITIYVTFHLSVFVTYILFVTQFFKTFHEQNAEATGLKAFLIPFFGRLAVIFLANASAMAIPNIALFISLVGALTLSVTGFAFPILMKMFVEWELHTGIYWYLFIAWCIFLIIASVFVLIFGVGCSIYEILQFYEVV